MPRLLSSSLTALALGLLLQAPAQAQADSIPGHAPSLTVLFQSTRSNAGPGQCGCFWLKGGAAQISVPVAGALSLTAEVAGGTAGNAYLGYPVSLVTFTAGPELRLHRRVQPFAQALLGGVHGFGLPFGSTGRSSASSFAFSAGGGLDLPLKGRLSLRALDAQYLYTGLPNTGSNRQNNLRLGAGLRLRLR